MTLEEQLKKTDADLQKLEEKKRELQEKRKKILDAMELEAARKEARKNQEVMEIIARNFGTVSEENLELFRRVMEEQSDTLHRRKQQMEMTL